jgi:hypothetical protein
MGLHAHRRVRIHLLYLWPAFDRLSDFEGVAIIGRVQQTNRPIVSQNSAKKTRDPSQFSRMVFWPYRPEEMQAENIAANAFGSRLMDQNNCLDDLLI